MSRPVRAGPAKFDWPALMRAGICGLRLSPEQFWALTPAELALMLGATGGTRPLRRDGLAALMDAFPDRSGAGQDTGHETGQDTGQQEMRHE